MQTFDALLPSSHSAPAHHSETNFSSEKPTHSGEKFGDVMDRALTGKSRALNNDDNDTQPVEKSGHQDAAASTSANQAKHATKARKPLHRELNKDNPAEASTTPTVTSGTHILHMANEQTVSEDEGSSEETPEIDSDKDKQPTAVGNSDATPKSTTAQFLALAGLPLGAPLPSSVPIPAGTVASKDAKGTSSPVLNGSVNTEALGGSPTRVETSNQPAAASQTNSDSKSDETKGDADRCENTLATSGAASQDQAAQAAEAHSNNADTVAAPEIPAPDSKNAQAAKPKASVENVTSPASDPNGTSAAKHYITMKKAEKTQKVAGPGEQDLPGDAATGSEELPMAQKSLANVLMHGSEKPESTATIQSQAETRISTSVESATPTVTSTAIAPAAAADTRLRVLERTHDIVALHAMRLGESGSDSLHVVVKPGAGIQLSLELRQSEGGIEVRASLHKGDFEHLNQYWPELQQRLEARGVRVGTLTCSDNFTGTSHQQFQQSKQQSSNQDPLYAGAFAEFALAGSMSEAPAVRAARATAYRGWETWA